MSALHETIVLAARINHGAGLILIATRFKSGIATLIMGIYFQKDWLKYSRIKPSTNNPLYGIFFEKIFLENA